jgi:maleate cis-trans isomerase
MDNPSRGRARIGVLVPFTNTNLEPDLIMLRPRGLSLHFTRLGGYSRSGIPDEREMVKLGASELEETLHLIAGVRPDVIMYGCTSATLTHGPRFDADLAERIKEQTGAVTVTAAGALLHGLEILGARRIGFASPYVGEVNDAAISFFAEAGFETLSRADIGHALDNYGQGALTPDEIFELALRADHPDAQALVLSCTDMRSVEIVERLEEKLDKPVVAANQAMLFMALLAIGIKPAEVRCGRLFRQFTLTPNQVVSHIHF